MTVMGDCGISDMQTYGTLTMVEGPSEQSLHGECSTCDCRRVHAADPKEKPELTVHIGAASLVVPAELL